MKFIYKKEVHEALGLAWKGSIPADYAPVFQIQMPEEEEEANDFATSDVLMIEEAESMNFNFAVANIVRRMNFFPGMGLGRRQ